MSSAKTVLTIREAKQALDRGDCDRAEEICSQLVSREAQNAAAWHLLGRARQKLGQRERAVEALTKAANLDRRVADYHYDLGNVLLDDGKIDRAISAFRRALRIDDTLAEAHNDLGAAYFQKGWHAEAQACFDRAIEHKPEHGIAHANLGAALRAQGKLREGRRAFQRALVLRLRAMLPPFLRWSVQRTKSVPADTALRGEIRQELQRVADFLGEGRTAEAVEVAKDIERRYPDDADVLQVAGIAFEEAKQLEPAIARTRAAIARKPDRAEYHITLARLLVKALDHAGALEAAMSALALEPGSAEIHATIAGIYHPWREDLAEEAARRAIALDPASHTGHGNLAAALWGVGKLEEAERHGREAMRLKPSQISYRTNLALICKDLGRIEEARGLYRGLLEEAPHHPKLAMDLGTLATECDGDLEAARRWYRKAQEVSGEPRAVLSEGLIDLLDRRFDTAWEKYEARKHVPDQRYQHSLFCGFPEWDGNALRKGRLLVYGEQGLGDEVMFASMVNQVPGKVALMCDPRLGTLFQRSFPGFEVIAEPRATQGERVKSLQDIGAAVAAGSLGRRYRRRREDFPEHRGYLVADPVKTAAWKERLAALGPGRKVGISWIGGLQKTGRSRRSLTVEKLAPVLSVPGIEWVSLQHGSADAAIRAFPGVTDDLDELASLVSALDLVVSVCNTNVHVAGALGKDVLVMAPFVPEWRYGISEERMLWYPSARILRQARYDVWDDVLARVRETLNSGNSGSGS